jgi:hypothetical protein
MANNVLNITQLPSTVTNQGNNFNGSSQLVKTTSDGKLPAIDGSNLTNLPSGGGSSFPSYKVSKQYSDSPYSIPDLTWVLIDSTSGIISVVLPATGKVRIGWTAGTNAVNLTVISSGTINGSSSYTIGTLNDSIDLETFSSGNWRVI